MKHYNNQEVDEKIHTFLSKKLQKFPELAEEPIEQTQLSTPRTSSLVASLIWTMPN